MTESANVGARIARPHVSSLTDTQTTEDGRPYITPTTIRARGRTSGQSARRRLSSRVTDVTIRRAWRVIPIPHEYAVLSDVDTRGGFLGAQPLSVFLLPFCTSKKEGPAGEAKATEQSRYTARAGMEPRPYTDHPRTAW